MALCKLCLQDKKLIKAHIIPQFLFTEDSRLISEDNDYPLRRPNGPYDPNILCSNCDNGIIGKNLENYAREILIDRKGVISQTFNDPKSTRRATLYKLQDKDNYSKIVRFFISVLWRASISSLSDFDDFSLGPHEDVARRAICESDFDFSNVFSVALCAFNNFEKPIHVFPSKFIRMEGINVYSIVMGHFKGFFKVDQRRLPPKIESMFISSQADILMLQGDVRIFPEWKYLYRMAKKN